MNNLLCLGFGYSAEALATRLAAAGGWTISGTATTEAGARRIRTLGHEGLHFDGTTLSEGLRAALGRATHVLVSIPPDEAGDPALRHAGPVLAQSASLRWIGYLSTVGVYGDHAGAWVDEDTSPAPVSDRSRRRLLAETAWLALRERPALSVVVFRLAGIYGPGRSAIDQIRSGTARSIVKPGQVFNRIHVEDVARVLEAAMTKGGSYPLYNLADDEPAPPEEVMAFAAALMSSPRPPQVPLADAELSPMARSFYEESKRVRNERMKSDLGVRLAYPTYREGLAAICGKCR